MKRIVPASLLLLSFASCALGPYVAPEPDDAALALAGALRAEDAESRRAAAEAAADVGPPAVLALGPLLAHEDPAVRKQAEVALRVVAADATAPGDAKARGEVAAACLDLIDRDPPLPDDARRMLVRVVGDTANDAFNVERLATLLSDATLRADAAWALARVDHEHATEQLVARLDEQGDADIVHALATKRDDAALDGLLRVAEGGPPAAACVARHALAERGWPSARTILERALARGEPGAADDLLRFAERRLEADDRGTARLVYLHFVDDRAEHRRAAAWIGLSACAESRDATAMFDALEDDAPTVRAAARDALVAQPDPSLDDRIDAAFAGANVDLRAELLRVRVTRGGADAGGVLLAALEDPEEEVRIAASALAPALDDDRLQAPLLARARAGSDAERRAALAAVLASLRRRLARDHDDTLATVHRVLTLAEDDANRAEAMRWITALADPRSLPVLAATTFHDDQRDRLAAARIAIAQTLAPADPDRARGLLDQVYDGASSSVLRRRAIDRLAELGVDVQTYPRRNGFLVDWHVVGPFAEASAEDLAERPFTEVRLDETLEGKSGTLAWIGRRSFDPDGLVDLRAGFEETEHVAAYAYAEFSVDGGPGELRIGSDDGVCVWLNDELVHENFTWRGVNVDEDRVPVTFAAGVNRLLVKVTQGGGDFGFCVRVAGADGSPIDFAGLAPGP